MLIPVLADHNAWKAGMEVGVSGTLLVRKPCTYGFILSLRRTFFCRTTKYPEHSREMVATIRSYDVE